MTGEPVMLSGMSYLGTKPFMGWDEGFARQRWWWWVCRTKNREGRNVWEKYGSLIKRVRREEEMRQGLKSNGNIFYSTSNVNYLRK